MNKETLPLISIVVAVFNGKETLQRCIDSVLCQTYPSKELIVIDGGSTDGTVEVLKYNKDKIDYWESRPDRGIYHAWNKAVDHSKGTWICFLGADDYYIDERSLYRFLNFLDNEKFDLISARVKVINKAGRVVKIMGEPLDWEKIKRYQNIAHPGLLHRRSLFEKYGKFNEQYKIAGDYDFLLRLGAKVNAGFVDDFILFVENCGLSRIRVNEVLKETRLIQVSHREIGFSKAWRNYLVALLKAKTREILCVS